MSNRDWLLIFVYLYTIGVHCQQVYRSLVETVLIIDNYLYLSAFLLIFALGLIVINSVWEYKFNF